MSVFKWNRKIHRWSSIIAMLPIGIIIISGTVLQLKKQSDWVQPPTSKGSSQELTKDFAEILEVASTVPEADIQTWADVDRLDVRPNKGIVKVRAKNRWEIQIDTKTGEVLQVSYRRSDLIESIHDGSFFHDRVKLWIFLPSALILSVLWITGIYLFARPHWAKWRKRKKSAA